MGALTPRDRDQVLGELLSLLPPGWAVPKDADSRLAALLGAPAEELARIEGSAHALLEESDPRTTLALFDEWERAFGLPDDCTPNWAFKRASKATYFDGAGVLRDAEIDEPRYVLDAFGQPTNQVIVEGAGTNFVRNPRAEGATPGTPGQLPTNWASGGIAGQNVLGSTSEDGIGALDLRMAGTIASSDYWWVQLAGWGVPIATPAAPGETWTGSIYARALAGAIPAGSPIRIQLDWFNAGFGYLSSNAATITPTAAALRTQRYGLTAVAPATTAYVGFSIAQNLSGPQTFDLTMRIGGPQPEKAAAASSLILPPIGSPSISTRAADILTVASLAERRARLLQRIAGNTGQSRAFFIALAAALGYAITIDEHTPARFGQPFGLPMNGEDWAHAWTVNAPVPAARYLRFGDSFGLPFQAQEQSALDCCFRALSPAHSTLIINPV